MNVVSFIEPLQGEVIERILRHCGLWQPRPPPDESLASTTARTATLTAPMHQAN